MFGAQCKKVKTGSIFSPNRTGHEGIVCSLANWQGIAATELAHTIRILFPAVFKGYTITCKHTAPPQSLPGEACLYPTNHNGYDYTIACLFAQEVDEQQEYSINYDALRKALLSVKVVATPLPARPLTRVRIPYRLACDLPDYSWNIVNEMIQDIFTSPDIPIEIWKHTPVIRKERSKP